MPVREIKTTIALDGEQQFKKALAAASREMRVMDSELKAVTAAYRANGDGAEYFASKQQNLKSQIAQQENIIKGLEQAVEDAAKAYGETSAEVDGYTIKLNNARAKLHQLEQQLSETDREVEELGRDSVKAGRQIEDGIGDSAQEAEKDVKSLVQTLQDDLSAIRANTTFTAISGLWDMAKGAYTSVAGFVEGTVEYRRQLSFLEQNAETHGFDFEGIKQQLFEVQSITGESSAAVEALSNLLAVPGMDDNRLKNAVDLLAGAVISFPETLKIESLADSVQETLSTGEATGAFAELLGRRGYSVDDFNTAMKNSETEAGDLDIVLGHLAASGMKDVYEKWQENNEAMEKAGQTQAELESEMARFGGTLEGYIVTPVKQLLVEALKWVNDSVATWEEYYVTPVENQGAAYHDVAAGLEYLKAHGRITDSAYLTTKNKLLATDGDKIVQADIAYINKMLDMAHASQEIVEAWAATREGIEALEQYETQQGMQSAEEIIAGLDLKEYYDDLEDSGEEAGEAMAKGFETAWEALENKAYIAGVSTGAAYTAGLDSQLGAISAAAARLSAVASAGISRAASIARMGITLNLDGRKVAEGLAPYTDEIQATYINFD